MDEQKKLKSPILEIWRRLKEGRKRKKSDANKAAPEKKENLQASP